MDQNLKMRLVLTIINILWLISWTTFCYAKPPDTGPKKVTNVYNTQINNTNIHNELKKKFVIEPSIRIYDSKKWEISPYLKSNLNNKGKISEAGVQIQFKFGKSYEEKEINKLKKELEKLKEDLKNENIKSR